MLTQDEFKKWAISLGYKEDAWGNFKKESNGKLFRFKLGKLSLRYETQSIIEASQYSKEQKIWHRLKSGYWKNLSITEENKLRGLKR
jgi:hypothetical protein